jgi:hypothetical protein
MVRGRRHFVYLLGSLRPADDVRQLFIPHADGHPGNIGTVVRRNSDDWVVQWDGSESQKTYR